MTERLANYSAQIIFPVFPNYFPLILRSIPIKYSITPNYLVAKIEILHGETHEKMKESFRQQKSCFYPESLVFRKLHVISSNTYMNLLKDHIKQRY